MERDPLDFGASPDARVDVRGKATPHALIATRDALRMLSRGGLLEVVIDEGQAADQGIASYFEKRGYVYELRRAEPGRFQVRVRNGA